jgi:hypothetical protein
VEQFGICDSECDSTIFLLLLTIIVITTSSLLQADTLQDNGRIETHPVAVSQLSTPAPLRKFQLPTLRLGRTHLHTPPHRRFRTSASTSSSIAMH